MPLRPRHRRDDQPDRGRARLVDPEAPTQRGRLPGRQRIQDELANGPKRRRVGIRPDGRAPAREGTEILALLGERLGAITSGGFGPSVNGPIAMGYVAGPRRRRERRSI